MVPSAMYENHASPRAAGYPLSHRSPSTPPAHTSNPHASPSAAPEIPFPSAAAAAAHAHAHFHQRMHTPASSAYTQTPLFGGGGGGGGVLQPDSRIYGRTKDLRKLADFRTESSTSRGTPDDATVQGSPGGPSTPAPAASLSSSLGLGKSKADPSFSVEVFAPAFDERGYPVFAGQAAAISATIRMPPSLNADIEITTFAYTTAGSSAAVWDGLILLPSASTTDKHTVFSVKDVFDPSSLGQLQVRSPVVGPPDSAQPTNLKGTPLQDDYVLTVPVSWRLPLGAGKAVIDGQAQSVSVALPPSFELTRADEPESPLIGASPGGTFAAGNASSAASIFRGSPPGSSAGTTLGAPTLATVTPKKSKARTLKGVVEKTLESVTRLGCFYVMEFALVTKGSAANGAAEKGSSSSSSKKSAEKAAQAAKERIIDVITIPFIFAGESTTAPLPPQALPPTLRPQLLFFDENINLAHGWAKHHVQTKWTGMMLRALRRGIHLELHLPSAPAFHAPSVVPFLLIIRPSDASLLPPAPSTAPEQADWQSQAGSGGRGSSVRRPATAPTVITNGSPSGSSVITRSTATGSSSRVDLTRVVRVSLVQVVYSTTSSVNDLPVRKRRIVSTAIEVEEVELGAFLAEDASTSDEKHVAEAQRAGVRVLAGKLRVSPYVTPTFRSQGIEVKYGIKVDLIPFGPNKEGKENAGFGLGSSVGGGSGSSIAVGNSGGGGGLLSSSRSIKEGAASSAASTVGTLTSAMKSLRLKTSTSRFGSSYAGSIFSGKSRRSRGFSDGTAVEPGKDWNATVSMPAGVSPSTSGLTSAQAVQQRAQALGGGGAGNGAGAGAGGAGAGAGWSSGGLRVNATSTQISFQNDSPPVTPPWIGSEGGQPPSGGIGLNVTGMKAHSPPAVGSSQFLASPSQQQLPRSVSEGTGLAHSATTAGGPAYAHANGARYHGGGSPTGPGHQINGGVASAASNSDESVDPAATAYDAFAAGVGGRASQHAYGNPSAPNSPPYGLSSLQQQQQPGNSLSFTMNSDVAQLVAASSGARGSGTGTGTGLASPLIGVGGGLGGGPGSHAGTSYAPSSWAPSGASHYSRWQAAAAAAAAGGGGGGAASTMSPTSLAADIESEQKKLSKLQKTVGAIWVDVRIVRGMDAPVAPAPHAGVLMNAYGVPGAASMSWLPEHASNGMSMSSAASMMGGYTRPGSGNEASASTGTTMMTGGRSRHESTAAAGGLGHHLVGAHSSSPPLQQFS